MPYLVRQNKTYLELENIIDLLEFLLVSIPRATSAYIRSDISGSQCLAMASPDGAISSRISLGHPTPPPPDSGSRIPSSKLLKSLLGV